MPFYMTPVCWEMCGYLKVEANSPEEAIAAAKDIADDCELPTPSYYVDGSFTVCEQIEEVKEV